MAHAVSDTRRILWQKESRAICKQQERRGDAGENHPRSGQSSPRLSVALGLSLSLMAKLQAKVLFVGCGGISLGALDSRLGLALLGGVPEWGGSCSKTAESKNHQLWKEVPVSICR